jgi:porin
MNATRSSILLVTGELTMFMTCSATHAQELPSTASDPSTAEQSPAAPEGILPIPNYTGDIWTRAFLTGDWNGTRTDWANKGIQFQVDWNQYVQGVVDGGRDETTQYGGNLDYVLNLDLMRMGV